MSKKKNKSTDEAQKPSLTKEAQTPAEDKEEKAPEEPKTGNASKIATEKKSVKISKEPSEKENTEDTDGEEDGGKEEEKVIRPRKRAIVKNHQLLVTFCIFMTALLFLIVWRCFFYKTLVGKWILEIPAETSDNASAETEDEAYSSSVVYEFAEDGILTFTQGTSSISGYYSDNGNVGDDKLIYANVSYGSYFAIIDDTFIYNITGNIFTGYTLTLESVYNEYTLTFHKGDPETEPPLFDDMKTDDRLVGEWSDDTSNTLYEFTSDGYLTRVDKDYLVSTKYSYSIGEEEGVILVKYITDSVQQDIMYYSFENDQLYINGMPVTKLDSAARQN